MNKSRDLPKPVIEHKKCIDSVIETLNNEIKSGLFREGSEGIPKKELIDLCSYHISESIAELRTESNDLRIAVSGDKINEKKRNIVDMQKKMTIYNILHECLTSVGYVGKNYTTGLDSLTNGSDKEIRSRDNRYVIEYIFDNLKGLKLE